MFFRKPARIKKMKFYAEWQAACLGGEHANEYFKATVPGNVQKDYGEVFNIGDLNYADNFKKYECTEKFFWNYRTTVNLSCFSGAEFSPARADRRIFFVTEGIEYEYDLILDGAVLLHHEGMYTRTEADLTEALSDGADHLFEIRIYPHPSLEGAPRGRSEAAQCCKPAVEYDWDWHPRMLVSGIFDDTAFEVRLPEMIADLEVLYELSEDLQSADVRIEAASYGALWTGEKEELLYRVCDPEGKIVYEGTSPEFTLQNVRLWWCSGQGEQALYKVFATLSSDGAAALSKEDSEKVRATVVGFRRIRLVMNADSWIEPVDFPKGRSDAPMTIELNGRVVFGRGTNWVNPQIYTSNIPDEQYDKLLLYAKEAHMNILRIWGGAIINHERFFEDCDKLGLMVWQEFPLACNNYVGTPAYLKILEQEATALICRLRRHACHVIWCGGNELFNNWSLMTDQSLALRLLNKLCYEYDQKKPYTPTAPVEGMGHGHYVLYDYHRNMLVHRVFGESARTAYSEFGVPSISDMDILKRTFPEDKLEDYTPGGMWTDRKGIGTWESGGADAWACFSMVDLLFGKQNSLQDYIDKTQWMQKEGYRFIFEEGRRQKPHCSLVMNWDYCEPWNNAAGHSLIAYPDQKRSAYYAVQDALRPVMPSARTYELFYQAGDVLKAELWMLNDSPEAVSDTIDVYFIADGVKKPVISWNTGNVPANENVSGHLLQIALPETEDPYVTLRLESAHGASDYQFYVKKVEEKVRDVNALNA